MRSLSFVLGALLLAGCEGGFAPPADGEEQTWDYTAYSAAGTAVVNGTFHVIAEGRDFKGTWSTHLLQPNADVGPQVGTGTLGGSWDVEGRSIILDMNPGWADNNVFLTGTPRDDGLRGTWSHSTLTGPRVGGEFVARRTD